MSFDIPIFFEDLPLFERDSFFQRQPRNKRFTREGRFPDVLQTWESPEFPYDGRSEERFYGPSYRSRNRDFIRQPHRSERSTEALQEGRLGRAEEEFRNEEDPSGSEANQNMQNYGWDIPVQFVKAPKPRTTQHRHQHSHEPHLHTQKNKTKVKSSDGQTQEPRSQSYPESTDDRNKTANGISEELAKRKTEIGGQDKPTERVPDKEALKHGGITEEDKMKKLPSDEEKSVDSNQDMKENDSVNIPVVHSTEEKPMKHLSRQISQCDPPTPTDIKLTRIKSIIEKSQVMEDKIKEFNDPIQSKKYLYISETLMNLLLDLDAVDSDGIDEVRKARREGVQTIQNLVAQLEDKLEENKKNGEPE